MYRHFAQVYDVFMTDVPYRCWAGYIDTIFKSHGILPGALILDVACGTGTMAFLMAKKGYDIIAVDASEDMLSEAYNKMDNENIMFLKQNILNLDLYGTVNAAYSTCDALNYILTDEDFEKALKNVALFLRNNPGQPSVFVFDLKTDYKYRQLGNKVYHYTTKDDLSKPAASYIWTNNYDAVSGINEYRVQFTIGDEKNFYEVHRQKAYSIETVTDLANRAGFQVVEVADNFTSEKAKERSERVVYVCLLRQ